MRKNYITPAVRPVSIVFGSPLLEIGIGSIKVNKYEQGGTITMGGDVEPTSNSRSTIWDDDTNIDEE